MGSSEKRMFQQDKRPFLKFSSLRMLLDWRIREQLPTYDAWSELNAWNMKPIAFMWEFNFRVKCKRQNSNGKGQ